MLAAIRRLSSSEKSTIATRIPPLRTAVIVEITVSVRITMSPSRANSFSIVRDDSSCVSAMSTFLPTNRRSSWVSLIPTGARIVKWNVDPCPSTLSSLHGRQQKTTQNALEIQNWSYYLHNVSAHRLRQLFRYRKPQAGSSVQSSRRRINLRERAEKFLSGFHWNADAGVVDRHIYPDLFFIVLTACCLVESLNPRFDEDMALLCELDSIPHQIDDDLSEPSHIAIDNLNCGTPVVKHELEVLGCRRLRDELESAFDAVS
ncbi:hypothetical protein ABW21_db0204057 [Orbilia brochopaga]|nr:hypothetical protein ABW21_db0204057 [Drechslerella brochopaga]